MVNLDEVVGRLLGIKGLTQIKQVAELLNISAADLSNRKKRGTLLPLLIDWALHEKVNLHWFVTGEAPLETGSLELDPDPEIADLLAGARNVLTSGNPVAFDALERNIRYFSHAIEVEKRMQGVEADLAEMKRFVQEMKKQEADRERLSKEGPLPDVKAA
jgi:hypothetical protein